MLCGKVLFNLDNHFRSFTFNLWNLVQTGKHSGIKFRPYRSPPPCAFNNFKQSLQIMKTPNGADGGNNIKKKNQSWKIRGKSVLATYQWGLFQIPFFFSSVPILQSLHSENLRGNNINGISHRLEDESRTGQLWLDWYLMDASESKESLSRSIWEPRSVH